MAAAAAIATVGCGERTPRDEPPAPSRGNPNVLVAAGDIAGCDTDGDEATAKVLARQKPGTVAPLGDNAYEYGTEKQFRECYGPTWGRFKGRTRPAVGNHEYAQPEARGHFSYFGGAAGRAGEGWYSYEAGPWHVVVLNSMCERVACGPGSPQVRWLRADLAKSTRPCTLAYFHHPRFSSGSKHGDHPEVETFWRELVRDRADLVLSAHDHSYERFAPLTPSGRRSDRRGLRQIVVGTGGRSLRPFGRIKPGSMKRDAKTLGILRLDLKPRSYSWRFVPAAGGGFTDSGKARCR